MPGDRKALACVVALALILLLAITGDILMRTLKRAIAALCLFSLSACASNSGLGEKALGNLEFCRRSYTAILGGIGTNGGSINIECPPRPFPAPEAPAQ
jgi:hypothetical protein